MRGTFASEEHHEHLEAEHSTVNKVSVEDVQRVIRRHPKAIEYMKQISKRAMEVPDYDQSLPRLRLGHVNHIVGVLQARGDVV